MRRIPFIGAAVAVLWGAPGNALTTHPAEPPLRFAELGTCSTSSGTIIHDCRIGYRTAGRLNERRDNAVVIPTWYGGTSADLLRLLESGTAFVDTTRFFVVLVDALGNGVSTSPSNSVRQPGAAFPQVDIADMVSASRRVVTGHLALQRLHAVLGYSMGAHQVLEWAVRHPTDATRFVSLLGTPRLATHDAFVMRSLRWMVRFGATLPPDSAYVPLVDMWHTVRMSPTAEARTPVDSIDARVLREARDSWGTFDLHDNLLQIEAMLRHDVSADFGHDLQQAAAAVRAPLLLVSSPDDRIVTDHPIAEFARGAGAEHLSVQGNCGHFVLYCDPAIPPRIAAFLDGRPGG